MGGPNNVNSPSLAVTFSTTVLMVTFLLYALLRFNSMIAFCRSASKTGEHPVIKNILMLLFYLYAPFVAISVTFSWVAWDQDWVAGWFFIVLPFIDIVLFISIVVVTKNDISHYVWSRQPLKGIGLTIDSLN